MQRKERTSGSGALITAAFLAAATLLTSFVSYRFVTTRELHLRTLIETSLSAGAHSDRRYFELEPGTPVTVQHTESGQLVRVHWQSAFAAFGDTAAWIVIMGLPVSVAIFLAISFGLLRLTVIVPLYRENKILAALAADARTMQMFAHDVRKPFSAVKAVIQTLHRGKTSETADIARRLLPEVDSLLVRVDQMIADMLQKPGSVSDVSAAPLDTIFDAAVREVSRKHPGATQKLNWQLRHSQQAAVSATALTRVIANLLSNAVEASSPDDSIRILTNDIAQGGVGITVGNSGPVIPPEVLQQLFTPFYTSGKKDGTGLGLAYVQSVIEEAGGVISVSSNAASGTEFRMNLPAARQMDKSTVRLPERFNEVASPGRTRRFAHGNDSPLRILVVEDNDCYVDALKQAAEELTADGICHFTHAKNAEEALLLLNEGFDLLICDIDLGPESKSGVTVIRSASKHANRPPTYIHSNAVLTGEDRNFIAQAVDGFLSKPVSSHALESVIRSHLKPAPVATKPVVAIIDDDCFVRELWSLKKDEITPMLFDSPEDFLQALDADPGLLAALDAVIVDYYFENSPGYTGDKLARTLRSIRNLPLIMSSDATGLSEDAVNAFDLIVSKDCMSWQDIAPKVRMQA